jgi:hypothetical protein
MFSMKDVGFDGSDLHGSAYARLLIGEGSRLPRAGKTVSRRIRLSVYDGG